MKRTIDGRVLEKTTWATESHTAWAVILVAYRELGQNAVAKLVGHHIAAMHQPMTRAKARGGDDKAALTIIDHAQQIVSTLAPLVTADLSKDSLADAVRHITTTLADRIPDAARQLHQADTTRADWSRWSALSAIDIP